ncbi:SdpI family protein [Robiginitalea sp. M366]|uniref:SdpI family protein n=1 Tax=Robiginitalea aestuariiviva TaxID=3036903 RepID=UPI00240D59B3|nr:SdpI family protein [Robiginitalea aestuariiviva]MDG1571733.1 SdpI family protein [Robiginitalea aestuariiviva]
MKTTLRTELPLLILVAVPFVYLWSIWGQLPESVPLHWNVEGQVDRYGSRNELLVIPLVTSLLIYAILLLVPLIDPKKRIQEMGPKYTQLRYALVTFMSGLGVVILYMVQQEEGQSPRLIFVLVGLLFAVLGNYMKTVKPNYFIGIRTPWTLENPEVWDKTHNLGGKLWVAGGLLVVLLSLLTEGRLHFYLFMGVVAVIAGIPMVYSYLLYRKAG